MIQIKNLKKTYGDRTVLDIPILSVSKGETVALIGPNGSGKSTLLKIIAGTAKKSSGEVITDGCVMYLPQSCVGFNMSVMKNLLYSMENKDEKKCKQVLQQLNLYHLKDKNAKSLSGGECQRLSLARILVNSCDCLLLDEPTSAVDVEGTRIIEKALAEYQINTGCAVIMSTHSPAQAKNFADRVVMLNNGSIAEIGAADKVLGNPSSEWGKKFIESWII